MGWEEEEGRERGREGGRQGIQRLTIYRYMLSAFSGRDNRHRIILSMVVHTCIHVHVNVHIQCTCTCGIQNTLVHVRTMHVCICMYQVCGLILVGIGFESLRKTLEAGDCGDEGSRYGHDEATNLIHTGRELDL